MKRLFATTLAIAATLGTSSAIAVHAQNYAQNYAQNQIATNNLGKIANSSLDASASSSFAQRSLAVAQLIPKDAVGFAVLDLDLNSWRAFEQFDLPAQSPLAVIDGLLGFLEFDTDISVAQDIQPWIGKEIAIAFLTRENGEDCTCVGSAIAAQITDIPKFDAFITKLENLDLPQPTQTIYKQVVIREWKLQESEVAPEVEASLPRQLLAMAQPSLQSRIQQNLQKSIKSVTQASAPNPAPKEHEDHADDDVEETEPTESMESEDLLPMFSPREFAIAKLPNGTAIFASDRQTLEQMIDQIDSGATSLAQDPLFLRSLQNPLWNRSLFAGYGNYASLGKLTELLAADLPEESPVPGFSRGEYIQTLKYTIAEYNTFDLFTWVTPKGIRSKSISYFTQARSPQAKDPAPRDRLLSLLPNNVYGSISSRNLNQQWQWLVKESENLPVYKVFVEGVRMIVPLVIGFSATDSFDIEKDLISWIDGEYAFVAFPSDRSPLQSFGVNLTMGMLIRTSQPEAANATLAKLTQLLTGEDDSFIMVKKRQVGATALTSLEVFDDMDAGTTKSLFAYGWRDRQTLLLTFGSDTAAEFTPTPRPSLADSEMFRDAIADMPQPNFGYFYLNMNTIARQVANIAIAAGVFSDESSSPKDQEDQEEQNSQVPEMVDQLINKLGGAVFVYSETSDRLQADAFFGIKK